MAENNEDRNETEAQSLDEAQLCGGAYEIIQNRLKNHSQALRPTKRRAQRGLWGRRPETALRELQEIAL